MSEPQSWSGRHGEKKRLCPHQKYSHIQSIALTVIATAPLFSAGTSRDNCDVLGNDERDPLYIGSLFQDYIISSVSSDSNGWRIINEIIFGCFCCPTTETVGKKEPKPTWYEIIAVLNSPNFTKTEALYHLNLRRRHYLLHAYNHNCRWQDSCVIHDQCPSPPHKVLSVRAENSLTNLRLRCLRILVLIPLWLCDSVFEHIFNKGKNVRRHEDT